MVVLERVTRVSGLFCLVAACSTEGPIPEPSQTPQGTRLIGEFVLDVDPARNSMTLSPLAPTAKGLAPVTVIQNGVPGTGPVGSVELMTTWTANDVDGNGLCGFPGSFCGNVDVRSFYGGDLSNVWVELTSIIPSTGNAARNSDPPPPGSGLSDLLGLWGYGALGNLAARGRVWVLGDNGRAYRVRGRVLAAECASAGLADDFSDGTVAPWTVLSGDVSVQAGRLRVVRTGSRWGEAQQLLPDALSGAWELEVDMQLLTTQSVVSVCIRDTDMYCLTLNTKTENGSTRGAHLFYNSIHGNVGTPPDQKLIVYPFDPGTASSHHLRLTRSETGQFEMFVDGVSRGTATDTRVAQFGRVTLYGMQDSVGGHGGYFDNVSLRCTRSAFCPIVDDFSDGTVAPWTILDGDVSVSSGRLRVVRVPLAWGRVSQSLGAPMSGAWSVEVEMELLTAQSVVSLCMDSTPDNYCLTLNTKTENGSSKGAHLFYKNIMDNVGSPPGSELIDYPFDPGVGAPHVLRLTRSAAGQFEMFVDGTSRGTATDTRLQQFDRVLLYGMQDSVAGHGGFFDDIAICY